MIIKNENQTPTIMENVMQGNGALKFNHLITKEQFCGSGRLFSIVEIPPNHSIGYHVHNNETETYHILSGTALYSDNGVEVQMSAGDTSYCASGEGHGIVNNGDETLVMIALIINSN